MNILVKKIINRFGGICQNCLTTRKVFVRCRSNYPHGKKSKAKLIPKRIFVDCDCTHHKIEIEDIISFADNYLREVNE